MATRKAPQRKVTIGARVRTAWSSKLGRTLRSPGMIVFLAGAAVSYDHIRHAALVHGQFSWWAAMLTPIMIDAMLIVAAKYITGSATLLGRAGAAVGFLYGAAATIVCNYLSAAPGAWGTLFALIPAGTVIVTAITLHWGEMRPRVATVKVRDKGEAQAVSAFLKAHRAGTVAMWQAESTSRSGRDLPSNGRRSVRLSTPE